MEDETVTQTKTSPVIAAVAFLGFGCAVVAAVLGGVALKKISATTDDINAKIEKNAAVELDIKKISDRIDALTLQLENVKSSSDRKVSDLIEQTQMAITKLDSNIKNTVAEVIKNREALEQIAARSTSPKQVKKEAPVENKEAETAQETPANAKIHKIKSGDTFAKLAKKYKVSVDAIVKANPQANPSKLKIGQEINIP